MPRRDSLSFGPTHTVWSILRHPGTVWALRAANERLVTPQDLPGPRVNSDERDQRP